MSGSWKHRQLGQERSIASTPATKRWALQWSKADDNNDDHAYTLRRWTAAKGLQSDVCR
jgi:hypothetical protein